MCVCALRLLEAIEIAAYLRSRRTYDEEQQQAKVQLSLNIMGAVVTLQWREATAAAADKQLYEDCRDFFQQQHLPLLTTTVSLQKSIQAPKSPPGPVII